MKCDLPFIHGASLKLHGMNQLFVSSLPRLVRLALALGLTFAIPFITLALCRKCGAEACDRVCGGSEGWQDVTRLYSAPLLANSAYFASGTDRTPFSRMGYMCHTGGDAVHAVAAEA